VRVVWCQVLCNIDISMCGKVVDRSKLEINLDRKKKNFELFATDLRSSKQIVYEKVVAKGI
jgi:hypothetical protein